MTEQATNDVTTDEIVRDDVENEEENFREDDDEDEETEFPVSKLANLEEKIHSQRWIVPVLPDQELVSLINISIALGKKGLDINNESCYKFYRDALVVSFTRILTDDAVNSWKTNIQHCIMSNCMKLIELMALKIDDDNFPSIELLGMVFNPLNK